MLRDIQVSDIDLWLQKNVGHVWNDFLTAQKAFLSAKEMSVFIHLEHLFSFLHNTHMGCGSMLIVGHLTTKSDVYSFGVVLLELLTGRRAMDKSRAKNDQNLVDWAKPYLSSSRRLHCVMDPRLCGQYSVKGAKGMASLALQCTSLNPKDRPRMPAIVEALESLLQFKDMAVTSGHWSASASPKHARNGVSAKAKTETGRGNLARSLAAGSHR